MEFPKYNWLQDALNETEPSTVYKYMSNRTLGGGPLDSHFQVGGREIRNPLYDVWEAGTAQLMDKYEEGDMTAGGFFILTNMQYQPGADVFADVALYAYGDAIDADTYDALLARNWTDHSEVQAPTCCFEDQDDGTPGIRRLLSGMARVIVYQVADVSDAANPNMTVTHVM